MRVVTDGPVVVCNLVPGVSEYGRDAEQERDVKAVQRIDSKQEGSVKAVQQVDSEKKDDGFTLGTPTSSPLAQRRRSPSPPKPKADPEGTHHSATSIQAPVTAHTQPTSAHQPTSVRKRHINQPSTRALIKQLHPAIRSRAQSLDPDPLEYYWDFVPHRRYWVKDTPAFQTIKLQNIPWMVTNGTLVETSMGLRWAGGDYRYLLRTLDDEEERDLLGEGIDSSHPIVEITDEVVRTVQLERWRKSIQHDEIVLQERPATPIVEKDDPFPVLEEVGNLPPTPSSARTLHPSSRSAFRYRRRSNSITPASPLSPLLSSPEGRPGSSQSDKGVRFHCRKQCRTVEMQVDNAGVAIEKEGKVVETKIDKTENLSDNEGRTSRLWLGKN
jgi:hypothetical protein